MTHFKFRRLGAFLLSSLLLPLLMFSMLSTGQAFAHTLSVTSTTARAHPSGRQTPLALDISQRLDQKTCFFEGCNGLDPESYGCTQALMPVSVANITDPFQDPIGQVVIWKSGRCGVYFAEVVSLPNVGAQPESVVIQRNPGQPSELTYGTGFRDATAVLSPMVGGHDALPIKATGFMLYGNGPQLANAYWHSP